MELANLKRLVQDVPRYTSYPTAAEFSPSVDAAVHGALLRSVGAAASKAPFSLYVHLPFCQAICHFCGCHALVARTPERLGRYLGALRREMDLVSAALGAGLPVGELHFGGGSPSLLPVAAFEQVMGDLRARFSFAESAAIALEADPRTIDREKLVCYRRQGVRRLSFGLQDLDPGVQRAIGRGQSAATSRAAYHLAREVGFDGINVDLCYGLPEQTEETFARTIDEVVRLRPDRVALFGYAHVPWLKPNQRSIAVAALPDPDRRLRLVADAHARLGAGGYRPIGFDHFALPGDPLAEAAAAGRLHRNFQGYTTTRTDALVGIGLSAISDLPAGYAQNARTLPGYLAALDEGRLPTERGALRSDEDRIRGDVIRRVMCAFRIDRREVERAYSLSFADTFARELEALRGLEVDGLVRLSDAAVELTELGRLFVRNVAVVFDGYRGRSRAETPPRRFSSSV